MRSRWSVECIHEGRSLIGRETDSLTAFNDFVNICQMRLAIIWVEHSNSSSLIYPHVRPNLNAVDFESITLHVSA